MNKTSQWSRTACVVLAASAFMGTIAPASSPPEDVAAELDAQRLIGKAYYENAETPPQFMPAADVFRHCIELAPDSAVDRFNLGLCLMRGEKFEEALAALNEARRLDPDLLAGSYVTGIVYKRLSKADEAIKHLKHVTDRDPMCMGAYYNVGVCYKFNKDYDKAIEAFKRAVELNPNHPSCHLQLMTLYRRLGDVENVKRHKEIFDLVKDTVDESEKTAEALERSRYSYIIEAPKLTSDLAPNPGAKVRFVDVTARAGLDALADKPPVAPTRADKPPVAPISSQVSPSITFNKDDYSVEKARERYVPSVGGAVSLGDFDSDGDLDIYVVNCAATPAASANRLYQNEGGLCFKNVTDIFGAGDAGMGMDAVFGDFDHDDGGSVEHADTNLDLYVINDGPNVLYHKLGHGAFEVRGLEAEGDTGTAVLKLVEPLPRMVEIGVDITSIEDGPARWHNAYVIFDYQGPDDFKFAGADMDAGLWAIGHYDGSWTGDDHLSEGLAIGKTYPLRLRLKGGAATLIHLNAGEEDEKVTHDFGELVTDGLVGLAARHAVARFDNVAVGEHAKPDMAPKVSPKVLYKENFKDGNADLFEIVNGTWEVVDWKYEEISEQARVQEPQFGRKAVFMDYDHDFDLDIFVVNSVDLTDPPDRETFAVPDDFGGQFNTLLRNNGNRTFSVQTDEARLLVDCSQTVDVLFSDFDDDTDTDIFIVNADAPSVLFINARLGKFDPGGTFTPPLKDLSHDSGTGVSPAVHHGRDARATGGSGIGSQGGGRVAAERDVNRDGTPDLLFAADNKLYLYVNDGKANFTGTALDLPDALASCGVGSIDICDYNNDGWADLLLAGADGRALCMMAGTGPARFGDVTSLVGLDGKFGQIADLVVADLDGDGDEDIVLFTRDRGLRLLRNDGGERAHWVNVCLIGKKVNRNGYGASVEIAAGGHYQKQTATDGWVHFGLGNLTGIDVIRVIWSNGQAQNVVNPPINTDVPFVQYVKVSASCGFLYADNGDGFELINEILGIGPLGVPMAPGVYFPLDHTELTKIESHQLTPAGGSYELRLTEELREITYADQITLRVVDHPAELEIIPNEKFSFPPPEDKFFAVSDHRPPVSAVDDRGADMLPLVLERDGRFPTFPLVEQYDGLAEPHALVLDLGDLSSVAPASVAPASVAPASRRWGQKPEQIMLYLDGWIYWAEASVSTAIFQDPRYEMTPLVLEVRDEAGDWQTAIESVGLPTSKGLVVPVDLTGLFRCDDYHVRLSTNMRIYFDRVFVSTHDEAARCRVTELPVMQADLHYRGFSRMTRDAFGFERFDYADVSPTGSWNPPAGMYTRYGDVTPLLASPDDMYVIFGPGDEMTMRFDASSLPDLPKGWTRDFIFYADGWVKDGDLNTALSETVDPLPFHGMSGYPYPPTEHYPQTHELNRYQQIYNTRPCRSTVGRLPVGTR